MSIRRAIKDEERTHNVCIKMHSNHAVEYFVYLGHHWFGDLRDGVRPNTGLSSSVSGSVAARWTHLIVDELLFGVVFLEKRKEVDDVGVLGWRMFSFASGRTRQRDSYIIIELVA